MAKQSTPVPAVANSGGGVLSKLVGFVVLGALVTLIVKYPQDSAQWTENGFSGLMSLVDGLVTFIRAVAE